MRFKEYLQLVEQNTVGKHNDYAQGAYLGTDWTGSEAGGSGQGLEGRGLHLPGIDLVPTVTKSSQIKFIERNKNPIFVLLADGTRLQFTWDEFNRIPGGQPKVGQTMTVKFQRFPGDTTEMLSQVSSVKVH